jgi:hypothetical protein
MIPNKNQRKMAGPLAAAVPRLGRKGCNPIRMASGIPYSIITSTSFSRSKHATNGPATGKKALLRVSRFHGTVPRTRKMDIPIPIRKPGTTTLSRLGRLIAALHGSGRDLSQY